MRNFARFVGVAVVVFLLAGIGFVDLHATARMSFSFFYLLPVAMSVILLGRPAGIVCSVCVSLIFLADQLNTAVGLPIAVWNTAMRLGTFVVISLLFHTWWTVHQDVFDKV